MGTGVGLSPRVENERGESGGEFGGVTRWEEGIHGSGINAALPALTLA
jgi:hypothetical protein